MSIDLDELQYRPRVDYHNEPHSNTHGVDTGGRTMVSERTQQLCDSEGVVGIADGAIHNYLTCSRSSMRVQLRA